MDDATIAEMARRGTFYVPTINHNRYYADHRDEFGYDQTVADRLDDYRRRNFETLKRAVRAKVKIAMGRVVIAQTRGMADFQRSREEFQDCAPYARPTR